MDGGTIDNPVSTCRQYTDAEVKEMFLSHLRMLVDYWDTLKCDKTQRERLEGLAFSILSTIDGCSMNLPQFLLVPNPHSTDKEWRIAEHYENYFPEPQDVKHNIAGTLHDAWFTSKPRL